MMFIEGHCPHCNEKRGFNLFAVSEYKAKRLVSEIKNTRAIYKSEKPAKFFSCGLCIYCDSPVLFDIEIKEDTYLYAMRDCITNHDKIYDGPKPTILRMYPQSEPPYTHPSLPQEINNDLVDLQKMISDNMGAHWVITGCRTILETSIKILNGEGRNLASRIEDLRNKSIINGVLADWARHIRIEGNSATHERTGTQEDALELMNFTKLFLQYTFEFPHRIQELRQNEKK